MGTLGLGKVESGDAVTIETTDGEGRGPTMEGRGGTEGDGDVPAMTAPASAIERSAVVAAITATRAVGDPTTTRFERCMGGSFKTATHRPR